tara:strand:+ start:524 stop:1744 length:1221 start_codon:yes stop_codon:yes gene_type:complete
MNNLKKFLVILILLITNFAHSLEDSVIAIVNDQVILKSELDERLGKSNIESLNRIQLMKLKNDLLDQLIEESLLDQASTRLGITVSDIDLQNQIKLIASNQGLTVLQLKDAVEKQNISYIQYLEKLRKKIKVQELFRTQFTNRAYVSEEEIASYIKNNQIANSDGTMKIREYTILDESNNLNLSQAKILLNSIKNEGIEESKKKYPGYDVQESILDDVSMDKLPDIYQNNLQILDNKSFSRVFKTGKGYTILEVLDSNILVEEYKVSHILLTTNPMEGAQKIKDKFYEIKTSVMSGKKSFSEYALEYSEDKASAIKGGSLGWITEKLVVTKFRQVMVNTEVGDVSEPFNTRFGWHILFLEDKRMKNVTNVIRRNQAIAILKDRKVAVEKREWLAKLKDQAYIEYVE